MQALYSLLVFLGDLIIFILPFNLLCNLCTMFTINKTNISY